MNDVLPDKVRKEFNLSQSVIDRLDALEKYDLSMVTNYLFGELKDGFIYKKGDHPKAKRFSPEQLYPIIAYFGKADKTIAQQIEKEFRKFVALTIIEPGDHAPPGPVDMFWHFFILHTTSYDEFSQKIWGPAGAHSDTNHAETVPDQKKTFKRIQHYPITEENQAKLRNGYRRTRELYEKVYGDIDTKMWPEVEVWVYSGTVTYH